MKMVLPMYCISVLNNWHFFRDIFKPFLHNAHSKSISFSKCVCLLGVHSNRSSMMSFTVVSTRTNNLIWHLCTDCHTAGEMLSPIGILWYKYDVLANYGSIPQYCLELSVNLSEWNASFKSSTDNTSHLEPPNNMNVSFNKGYAKLGVGFSYCWLNPEVKL